MNTATKDANARKIMLAKVAQYHSALNFYCRDNVVIPGGREATEKIKGEVTELLASYSGERDAELDKALKSIGL